jgi:CRISPR-associated protein Csb2
VVNAAAAVGGDGITSESIAALEWLERLAAPVIVAPAGIPGSSFSMSVPFNAMDVVARSWARGNSSNIGDANPATHRHMKDAKVVWIESEPAVHYVWSVSSSDRTGPHVRTVCDLARQVVRLGWGVDMAIADASLVANLHADQFRGIRWTPGVSRPDGLLVPVAGTLKDLIRRHGQFLRRLETGSLVPPDPVDVVGRRHYRRAGASRAYDIAAFGLLDPTGTKRVTFDTPRTALTVAGRLRDAVRRSAQAAHWDDDWIDAFVLGHSASETPEAHTPVGRRRFAYWPVPSVEHRGADRSAVIGSIRRVIVTSFDPQSAGEVAWTRRALSGQDLIDEDSGRPVALLSLIHHDAVVQRYTAAATTWMTVTPVVLPGYDDPKHYRRRLHRGVTTAEQASLLTRLSDRVEGLLRKAMSHAGIDETLASRANIQWRSVGFWQGTDRADCYGVPDHLRKFPRYHVAVRWRDEFGQPLPVRGPFCIGAGRYYGLGLFAAAGNE